MRIEPLSVEPKAESPVKTRHSLTYSAYGLPHIKTLAVTSGCYELRLAPAMVGVHGSSAPQEVLYAIGPADSITRSLDLVI